MDADFIVIFAALCSGGLITQIFIFVTNYISSSRKERKKAKQIIDTYLDQLLKAADEVVGKTISLGKRDFVAIIHAESSETDSAVSKEFIGLVYLYAQFWSRLEILRQESMGLTISSDKRGKKLNNFISCLESQGIRLVDRTHQKAIGDITTGRDKNGKQITIGLIEFESRLANDKQAKDWAEPLLELLKNVKIKSLRQRVLLYGAVMHLLVDTLDSNHHTTHPRPAYPNKLSKDSIRALKYKVGEVYLKGEVDLNDYIN